MDEPQVIAAINQARKGIAQYLEIMGLLPTVDVGRERNFQRKYIAFYRVRQRPKEWYELYFSFLESSKANPPTFDDVIDYLYSALGRYEPSFSSKLVATLDPHQPVWDRFVLRNTGQMPPAYGAKNRLQKAKNIYRNIQGWYQEYMDSAEGGNVIAIFNREVPIINRSLTSKRLILFFGRQEPNHVLHLTAILRRRNDLSVIPCNRMTGQKTFNSLFRCKVRKTQTFFLALQLL